MAEPAADTKALVSFLDEIDSEIKSHRQSTLFDENAELWLKYRHGDSWQAQAGERPIFMANLVGNLIERKIAVLTQSQPDILVAGRNPLYANSARVLTEACSAILSEQRFDAKVESGADLAATMGHVMWETAWDPSADFGQGDIVIRVLDPRRVFVDHHVRDVSAIDEAQYIRIDTPMPLHDIQAMWPGRGANVQPSDELTSYPSIATAMSWWGGPSKRPINQPRATKGPYDWAKVSQYWLRSPQESPTGEALFPTGRRVVRAGDVLLEDGPNPYWDGSWPVDIWDWRVNADSHMGRSDVAECLKLQEALNRLGHAIMKNVLLNSSITIIGDYNALQPEDWKKLDNRAARIIKKMPGRQVEFVPPPPIPSQYLQLVEMLSRFMETLVGVPEAMQGKRQAGVVAASAVEGLMVAAETLVRAAARRLEYVIERIGLKLISRVIQFYTSDRVMMTQGPTKEWQEYVFRRAELLGPLAEGIDPATGTPLAEPERLQKLREFFTQFRFKVTPLSSMPQNRIQRSLLAMQLAQMGMLDAEEVLRVTEWPNWKDVLQRVGQKQATGQMPPPGMGGNGDVRSNRRGTAMKLG